MAQMVLGVAGAIIGGIYGGPAGAQAGFMIGSALGSALFPPDGPVHEGPRLNDLAVQQSSYGAIIPRVYGRYRLSGNVIWATDIIEHKHEEEVGGKGGGGGETQISYTYTCSFALSLCEGEIAGITRIWADGKLIYDAQQNINAPTINFEVSSYAFYNGSEDQMPDPTMEADLGAGNVPAYRGQAIAVFADLQLKPYGNRLPNLTFEVIRTGSSAAEVNKTVFATDSSEGGDNLIYNPVLNEVWNFANSSFAGVVRYDADTFERIGSIDSTGASGADPDSGIFGKPQYDSINGRIYIMGVSPRKVLRFDAVTATFLGRLEWPSSFTPSYFAVSPLDGTIWGVDTVAGVKRLQQINPLTAAVMTDVDVNVIGGERNLLVDNSGVVYMFGDQDLWRYSGGVVSSAKHDTDGVSFAEYDPENNMIWYQTKADFSGTLWRGSGTVTNISNANPAIVTYTPTSGVPFSTGQTVEIYSVDGMDELFPEGSFGAFHFEATVIDSTHLSIPVDTTNFTPYEVGTTGSIISNNFRLKRFNLAIGDTDLIVDVDGYGYSNTRNLMYDPYRHLMWVFNDEGSSMTGFSLVDGEVQHRICFLPNNYPWWVSAAPNALWVNDSTFENVIRISFDSQIVPVVWTVGMVVADISYFCGMTGDDIDVSALTTPIRGYGLTTSVTGRGAIEPLMKAYMFDSVDSGGKVKYVMRGNRPVVLIDSDELVLQ